MDPASITKVAKGAAFFAKYTGALGKQLREKHWAKLWECFWDDADPSKREAAINRLCSEDEPRFAAWLFGLFVQVNEARTMAMLGKWTVHVGLSEKSIDHFYRGARAIVQTFGEDLDSLLLYAAAVQGIRDEGWEAITLAGFARRVVTSPGMAFDATEIATSTRYEITELGRDFIESQGGTCPPVGRQP